MTPDDFVQQVYNQKRALAKLAFDPERRTLVTHRIAALNLSAVQTEKLRSVVSGLLTDAFYTMLLGLDGAACIGNTQNSYTVLNESGETLTGDLEELAYALFYSYESEPEHADGDIVADLHTGPSDDPDIPILENGQTVQFYFPAADIQTSGVVFFPSRERIYPAEPGIGTIIRLSGPSLLAGKLRDRSRLEIRSAAGVLATASVTELLNASLRKS